MDSLQVQIPRKVKHPLFSLSLSLLSKEETNLSLPIYAFATIFPVRYRDQDFPSESELYPGERKEKKRKKALTHSTRLLLLLLFPTDFPTSQTQSNLRKNQRSIHCFVWKKEAVVVPQQRTLLA